MGEWHGEREESDEFGLRPTDKTVLYLAKHGLSIPRMAQTLGISEGRIKKVRQRVREVLGIEMDADFGEAVTAAEALGVNLEIHAQSHI